MSAEIGVGFAENVFGNNNNGDGNPQVLNGTDLGSNMCAGTPGC